MIVALRACLLGLVLFLLSSSDAFAQGDELVLIDLIVTGVSGRSVYVDKGRDDGLEPGDRVRFFVTGEGSVEGEVRSIATTSARVELDRVVAIDVGSRAEARVPIERAHAKGTGDKPSDSAEQRVEHAPWTRPPETWDQELPLLAPLEEIQPEDRELEVSGRAFAQAQGTWDDAGAGSDTLYSRAGADLVVENPFGNGGLLNIDTELVSRRADFTNGSSDVHDERLRLQRLSYAIGGTRFDPTRVELGRFLQSGTPEFGLLDGVEASHFLDSSTYFGVAAGLLPEPTFELSTGEDVQVAANVVRDLAPGRDLAWRFGVQKTWHNGAPDRDLLASALHWRASDEVSVRGSALVDYYTSGERVKSAGFELTEAHVFADWRPSNAGGVSASFDQVRWPDIERQEFVLLPDALLINQRFTRSSVRVWRKVAKNVQLSVRGDLWSNDDDQGTGAELRVDWHELLWKNGQVRAAAFQNVGQFSDIEGVRLGVDRDGSSGRFDLTYELAIADQDNFVGEQGELLRQSLRASWDMRIGAAWSLSLFAERLFGDAQDAISAGFYLQRRF